MATITSPADGVLPAGVNQRAWRGRAAAGVIASAVAALAGAQAAPAAPEGAIEGPHPAHDTANQPAGGGGSRGARTEARGGGPRGARTEARGHRARRKRAATLAIPHPVMAGDALLIRGRLPGVRRGSRVALQRRTPRRAWIRVAIARVRHRGAFVIRWRTSRPGRFTIRVVAIDRPSTQRARSKLRARRPASGNVPVGSTGPAGAAPGSGPAGTSSAPGARTSPASGGQAPGAAAEGSAAALPTPGSSGSAAGPDGSPGASAPQATAAPRSAATPARRRARARRPLVTRRRDAVVYAPSLASWFGPGFYGRRTFCGVVMTAGLLGVAHRTLPCGTLVEVTYGGRTAVVPVVDRGPFRAARTWDLTAGLASKLGFAGTHTIGVVALTPGSRR